MQVAVRGSSVFVPVTPLLIFAPHLALLHACPVRVAYLALEGLDGMRRCAAPLLPLYLSLYLRSPDTTSMSILLCADHMPQVPTNATPGWDHRRE